MALQVWSFQWFEIDILGVFTYILHVES